MLSSIISSGGDILVLLAILIAFLSALFISMPAHEFAHAHAALKEGDPTAKVLGRHTLAPFAHIDWWGLLLLLVFGIGFAKPVPVDPNNFKNGKKSSVKVALAGVFTNLIIGIVSTIVYAFLVNVWPEFFNNYGFISDIYYFFFNFMISINFMFAFFNILPIYPLDGFRVVETFTKPYSKFVTFMKTYGFYIMILVVFTGLTGLYLQYTAGLLSDLLFKGMNKLFALIF